uniref:Uncharacterized protein n=1 Tax=viral metagenome TaxID=1070528 RepID=A0A6H1Z8F4_9ZZZZ
MVLDRLEKTLGLPPLSEITRTLEKVPDEKRLKAIKSLLLVAERVSKSAPELDKVVQLVQEINSMPLDKLVQLEKVLKRVEKVMKLAPKEVIDFLSSLKGE